jgi:hypothetical protein
MLKIGFISGLIVLAFLAGITVARSQDENLVVRASVRDANTIPERIEYWELSLNDGAGSITIMGPKELPMVSWLRRMKGGRVVVTLQRDSAPR